MENSKKGFFKSLFSKSKVRTTEEESKEILDEDNIAKLKLSEARNEINNLGAEDLQRAKEIIEEFPDDKIINSQFLTIISKNEIFSEMEYVKKIYNNFQEDDKIVSQVIKILEKSENPENIKNAIEIASQEKFREIPHIQAQLMKLLIEQKNEGWFEKIKDISSNERFENDYIIQMQYINASEEIGTKESIEEALKICEKEAFANIREIKYKKEVLKAWLESSDKNDEYRKLTPAEKLNYLNKVKTEMYYDRLTQNRIEEIRKNIVGLDQWRNTIVLLAIYDKTRNTKIAENLLKEAKSKFKEEPGKIKILNKLQNSILSKKQKIFDWNNYDMLLKWYVDDTLLKELEKESIEEETNTGEHNNKLFKNDIKEKSPVKPKSEKKYVYATVGSKRDTSNDSHSGKKSNSQSNNKVLNNKNKKNNTVKKFLTIEDEFSDEIIELKVNIIQNNDMKMLDKLETIENKDSNNERTRLKLVVLLNKFGMSDVAEKKLKKENEIYNKIIANLDDNNNSPRKSFEEIGER